MTDELKLAKQWQKEARRQTLETLPAFLQKLTDHPHDYGTIVRAIGAAAVGAAWAIEKSPQGGISGFQASCITWEFIEHWGHITAPAWLQKGEDMLYPQYTEKFTTITEETWKWLQDKARENLAAKKNNPVHNAVVGHWQAIVDGKVPFGFQIRKGA